MTVLITGCAGFIGSNLAEELLKRGEEVIGIDNFEPYYSIALKKENIKILRKYKNFKFKKISVLNINSINFESDIDIIYHEAAIAGTRSSIKEPFKYCKIDVLGTVGVLEFARKTNSKVVYASSSSVYGEVDYKDLPVKESRPARPISPYGLAKFQGEEWCNMFTKVYGIRTVCLRYFTVYGPRQRPDEAFMKFMIKILKNEPIEIYGDGSQTRDFTFIKDVVEGTILAGNNGNGVYNIASGKRIVLKDAIKIIKNVCKKEVKIKYIEKQEGDVTHTLGDISKAKNELGYLPKTTIEEGIKQQIDWIKTKYKNIS